jgi:MFS family permease
VTRLQPRWWGSKTHITYTIVVFVVLASLDNAAIAMILAMVKPVEQGIETSTAAIGVLFAAQTLVLAASAVFWGYAADAGSRKRLLVAGTLLWATAEALSTTATSFAQFFGWQMVVGIGLGSIASVGFSVISDYVGPSHRGLAMSFWGISQGIGAGVGIALASQLGADDFRMPLLAIAALGALFAFLYLFAFEAPRGFREPELQEMYAEGGDYDYRIDREQLGPLLRQGTNRWIVLQGLIAQLAYGSLLWITLLYQEKVIAQGYSEATGTKVGGLLVIVFAIGSGLSILAGHVGDRFQRRSLRGRALVSAVGTFAAIPFFLIFFWVPLRGLEITEGAGTLTLLGEIFAGLFTNPWLATAFVSALFAYGFTSVDSPNGFALIADVNLPEHRGTVFGVRDLGSNIGRSLGIALAPALAGGLERSIPPPINWIVTLSVFQMAFIPAGWCYWKASETCPADITEVHAILSRRGSSPAEG